MVMESNWGIEEAMDHSGDSSEGVGSPERMPEIWLVGVVPAIEKLRNEGTAYTETPIEREKERER